MNNETKTKMELVTFENQEKENQWKKKYIPKKWKCGQIVKNSSEKFYKETSKRRENLEWLQMIND